MSEQTLDLIKESEARWVDLRFTDTRGKEQHVSIPSTEIDADFFEGGKMFDGSSISGWKGINESDMILMPDDTTSVIDPFTDETTIILRCDIVEPVTGCGTWTQAGAFQYGHISLKSGPRTNHCGKPSHFAGQIRQSTKIFLRFQGNLCKITRQ